MRRRTTILIVLVALSMALAAGDAVAKSYSIPGVSVRAHIGPDGAVAINEEITYRFDGSFTYAYRDIPLKPGEEITDIRVFDSRQQYERSTGKNPGTYDIRQAADGLRITWYYSARDETRTFNFAFTARGVVKCHADVAEFYYQFVGNRWDRTIDKAEAVISFDLDTYASDLRAWAHGPLQGTVSIGSDGKVTMAVAPLPARTYWEGRVVFPLELVPGMTGGSARPMLETILADERQWADEANRFRAAWQRRNEEYKAYRRMLTARAQRYLPIAFFLGILALLLWYLAYRAYGAAYKVKVHGAPGDIPSDHPPAIVSYLVNKTVGAPAIVATLVDLAERGYFTIREEVDTKSSWFGTRKQVDYVFERTDKLWADMTPWELGLVEFLITEVGDMNSFSMLALKRTARSNRTRFLKWFQAWIKSVKAAGEQYDFFEPNPAGAMWRNAGIGLVAAACGIFFCVHSRSPAGTPAIVGGFLALILTGTLNRRTIEGQRLANSWRVFKEHIKSISRALGPVSLDSHTWSRYLGIAIIFGLHKKLVSRMQLVDDGGSTVPPVWYYGAFTNSGAAGIGDFANGITAMVSSMSTSVSSASGAGGGASAGGGGGSGGGGGGAG